MWNQDKDLHSIEYSYIYNTNAHFSDSFSIVQSGKGYKKRYSDKKKFTVKPNTDTFIVPVSASSRILSLHNQYQTDSNPKHILEIIKLSEWLKDTVVIQNNCAKWPYPIKFNKYPDLPFDWDGAWALGVHLSAIARAYQITKDSSYIELGNYVLNTFSTLVEKNGILSIDKNGCYWFEEYPTVPPSSVLNGHINGMFGLYDYWRATKDERSKALFDKGVNTVIQSLDRYDSGYWSYYDNMYNYVTDYKYHVYVHIPQLKILYQITNEETFKTYIDKWEGYKKEPYYTIFKLKILHDALHRRLTYKSW